MEDFIEWGAVYLVYQEEVGESGTHHLQGYIQMPRPVRWSHFKLDGAHWEVPNGTPDQNIAYCTKSDSRVGGPYMYGVPSKGMGARNDLLALRDAVRSGKRGRELFDDDALAGSAIRYCRGLEALCNAYMELPTRTDVRVIFHYGPPGTGKTHCAHTEGAYYYDGHNGFWNNYKGESVIILDEFGGHVLTPLLFQRLCDKYPLSCNVKGGSVPCRATTIHICSNYLPSQWWSEKTRYNSTAIYRRIHEVHFHDVYKHYVRYVHDENVNEGGLTAMDKLSASIRNRPSQAVLI